MTDTAITFRVFGHPQPGGSKRAFPIRAGGQLTGRVAVADSNPRAKDWKQLVIAAAFDHLDTQIAPVPYTGPLVVEITFLLARPKGHYGTGRHQQNIRRSAPTYPAVRPDVSKLARPTIDALTGVVWRDDAQIVDEVHRKRYETPEGAYIHIQPLPERSPRP
jgi:Holliday junction resolvase RusA-like endonuclease